MPLSATMIKVRRYQKGEEDTLRQICRDTTLLINLKEYGPELVRKWVKRLDNSSPWNEHVKKRNPFVAVSDNEVVGFAEFSDEGKIGAFYSHHQWQQKGIGSALLERIEAEAAKLGIGTIWVESSLSASNFFESKGFKIVEEKEVFTDGVGSKSLVLVKSNPDNKRMQPDKVSTALAISQ